MGRSVNIPRGAQVVAFNYIEYDGDHDDWSYDDFVEGAQYAISEIAPSMQPDSGWIDREGRVIASNSFAQMVISEYCGLVSVCLVPEEGNALAEHWCAQLEPKFMMSFSELRLIGRASNGEAFFEKAA
jgi:hypothetical protein